MADVDLRLSGISFDTFDNYFGTFLEDPEQNVRRQSGIDDGGVVVRRRPARPKEGVRSEMMTGVHGAGISE